MAAIEYIGVKPEKTDNVAKTRTVWNGPGDVQEVADPVAVEALLRHPNVWRLAEAMVGDASWTPPARVTEPARYDEGEQQQDPIPAVDFNRLAKPALVAFAREHLSVELDPKKTVADMRSQVASLAARRSAGV